ncbi:flagellar filament capping protein FliD [Bacillus badius]|uniref:Flagellar hook-associated protein 2 n=1 Tax=Bacillus badius TaxID=1455 RepID=A0ABR5AUJ0_BACBA|nr:flagellar filament capping protein FliD [Bacillus badius]KIL78413.1 Flagellar hook-associated protein FliD [Bacillus badius]MED4716071.1 flagellar filament capping protein FliD [Bacillus badius]
MVRIGGLASGMDIDQMVKDLMKAERMPLDKLKQKKQVLEWQRDDYRTMNTLLLDFRSELTQMKLTTKYRARAAASTNEDRVTATASSAAGASSYQISKVDVLASSERLLSGTGKIELDPSKDLYSQAQSTPDMWRTGTVETKSFTADGSKATFSLEVPTANLGDFSSWSVKVNGKGYKVITDQSKWEALASDDSTHVFVDSATGNVQFKQNIAKDSSVRVDYIAKEKTDTVTLAHDSQSVQLSRGSISAVTSFSLKKDDGTSQNYVVNNGQVFKEEDTGFADAVATFDKVTGKITFIDGKMDLPPKANAGEEQTKYTIEVTYKQNYTTFSLDTATSKGNMHENFIVQGNESLTQLGDRVNSSNVGINLFYDKQSGQMTLNRAETGKFNDAGPDITVEGLLMKDIFKFDATAKLTGGKNAVFTINGLTTERNSNTFEMNGVTFTLKQTFAEEVSVSVNNDSTKVFDNIKEFVNKYNELIDKIQKKTSEERYRKYTPLTDDQRETLSDKQQEKWEEMAKSGLLRRDPLLGSVLTNMRMNFSQPVTNDKVSGAFNQLAKIGITTTANYLEGGKLEINEAKLRKAIEEDPESVENLFRGDGATDSQKGIVQRLYDTVSKTMNQLKEKAGNSFSTQQQFAIGRTLKGLDSRINSFEKRLVQVEDRYWRQFTAMEKAIQRSNQQSMYLMNQFGGQ